MMSAFPDCEGEAIAEAMASGWEGANPMAKIIASAIAVAMLLAGCASAQQRLEDTQAAEDDAKCKSYGAKVGTDAYVSCRTQLAQVRATKAAATGTQARNLSWIGIDATR
jgi:hypothetical protein